MPKFEKKLQKICPKCGFERPREDFIYGGQVRKLCKKHYIESAKQYKLKHIKNFRKWEKERYWKDPDKFRQKANKENANYRKIALEHYGGNPPVCACCGEKTYEFLSLDHIAG